MSCVGEGVRLDRRMDMETVLPLLGSGGVAGAVVAVIDQFVSNGVRKRERRLRDRETVAEYINGIRNVQQSLQDNFATWSREAQLTGNFATPEFACVEIRGEAARIYRESRNLSSQAELKVDNRKVREQIRKIRTQAHVAYKKLECSRTEMDQEPLMRWAAFLDDDLVENELDELETVVKGQLG